MPVFHLRVSGKKSVWELCSKYDKINFTLSFLSVLFRTGCMIIWKIFFHASLIFEAVFWTFWCFTILWFFYLWSELLVELRDSHVRYKCFSYVVSSMARGRGVARLFSTNISLWFITQICIYIFMSIEVRNSGKCYSFIH